MKKTVNLKSHRSLPKIWKFYLPLATRQTLFNHWSLYIYIYIYIYGTIIFTRNICDIDLKEHHISLLPRNYAVLSQFSSLVRTGKLPIDVVERRPEDYDRKPMESENWQRVDNKDIAYAAWQGTVG